jgi:GTP cyclohydrolase II
MIVGRNDVDLNGLEADVQAVIDRRPSRGGASAGPCVTLSYAQTLDGSIAAGVGSPLGISGDRSLDFTHRLRAMHDAILVGINTVLTDDPQLTVRRVSGRNPRPVVVDSRLRIPLDCRLVRSARSDQGEGLVVATTDAANAESAEKLESCGVEVWALPALPDGCVDLRALFARLGECGHASVMVEGGARVITSVISCGLAHQLLVTIAPRLLGGIRAFGPAETLADWPDLVRVRYRSAGTDLLVHAEFA